MKGNKEYCIGCHDNFYNGNNDMGIKECWNLKCAKVVKKWCIGWWTPMDKKENLWQVTTNNCHCEPGRYAYLDKLPAHLA